MANSCALAQQRLARYVAELEQKGGARKATTAIKAGYVGSIVTPMRAVAGNASWGGLRHLAAQPLESGLDYVASVAKSAGTGFKNKPHEFREVANALRDGGAGVLWDGFKKGTAPIRESLTAASDTKGIARKVQKFVEELSTRLDADNVTNVLEFDRVKYKSPVVQTAVDGAYAILEAADRPFWRAAFDASTHMQSRLLAIREGLTGEARAKAAARYFENPTDEMVMRATDDANYATFKDETLLGRGAAFGKRWLEARAEKAPDPGASPTRRDFQALTQRGAKVGHVAVEMNLPFTGVPSSVAGKIGAMSPLGLLSPRILGNQAQKVRAIANASLGTAMWVAGYAAFKKGMITGAMPTTPAERAQWDQEGRQPYSVLIGDKWVGLQSLGPASIPFFIGAQIGHTIEDKPDAGAADIAGSAFGFVGQVMSDQSYLRNVGNLVNAMQDEHKAEALAASQIPAPSIVGQLNRALDPNERDLSNLGHRILASKVPGGSFLAPKKQAPGGGTLQKDALERASSLVSPFPVRSSTDTPVLKEMRRLGVTLGFPSRTLQRDGKKSAIPQEEYRAMVERLGPEKLRRIEQFIASEKYQRLSDDKRRDEINRMRDQATTKERAKLTPPAPRVPQEPPQYLRSR